MAATGTTAQWSEPKGSGAAVPVGLAVLAASATGLIPSTVDPASARFVASSTGLIITDGPGDDSAHLLAFGNSLILRDNP
jgi:hypothetical protein